MCFVNGIVEANNGSGSHCPFRAEEVIPRASNVVAVEGRWKGKSWKGAGSQTPIVIIPCIRSPSLFLPHALQNPLDECSLHVLLTSEGADRLQLSARDPN
jgi:hypothetical protein